MGDAPAPPRKPPQLKTTLESLFSNENLKQDRYLLQMLADSFDGWLDVETVLGLKRIKALRVRREDVLKALSASWLETHSDPESGAAAVRRPPSKGPLPQFQATKAPVKRDLSAMEQVGTVSADVTTQQRWVPVEAPAARPVVAKRPEQSMDAAVRGTYRHGRLNGTIASFSLRLGTGKISCKEIGRDVAVAVVDLAGFDIGDLVSFVLTTDPELGTPKAKQLKLYDPLGPQDAEPAEGAEPQETPDEEEEEEELPPPPPKPTPQRKSVPAKKKIKPAAKAAAPQATAEAEAEPAQPQVAPGTHVVGVIQGLKGELGTVMCNETGNILELTAESLAGFEEGDTVSFLANAKGHFVDIEAA